MVGEKEGNVELFAVGEEGLPDMHRSVEEEGNP